MKTKLLYISTIFLLLISSCIKDEDKVCPNDFMVYGTTTPYDSIYNIGDTLTLSCSFNYMVYEKNTKKHFDLSKISNIESSLIIYYIDTICYACTDITDYIDVILDSTYNYYLQHFSDGFYTLYSNIIFQNDTFKSDIKIIFKKKGLYLLSYGDFSIDNNEDFPGKCKNADFNLSTRLNEGKDNNIKLLALSPDEHFNNWILIQHPVDNFYNRGCFAYKVE